MEQRVHTLLLVGLGKGPIVSWTPGDVHWGLVAPARTCGSACRRWTCLGWALGFPAFSLGAFHKGKGPRESWTPGVLHCGHGATAGVAALPCIDLCPGTILWACLMLPCPKFHEKGPLMSWNQARNTSHGTQWGPESFLPLKPGLKGPWPLLLRQSLASHWQHLLHMCMQ